MWYNERRFLPYWRSRQNCYDLCDPFFFKLNFADGQHFHTETCVVSLLPRSTSNSFVSVNEPSWPEMMGSFLLPKISSRDRTYPSFFKHLPTVEFIWCTIVQLKKKMQRKKYCIFIWLNFDKMCLWLHKTYVIILWGLSSTPGWDSWHVM